MAKEDLILFGGSGGLGSSVKPYFDKKYNCYSLSSSDADITSYEAVNKIISNIEPSIILNMSGYNYDKFIHKYEDDTEINKMINVNINGNLNILRSALPIMRKKNFGRIILTSSVLSKKTVVGTSIYSSTKSFIDTLVRVAAVENASRNITVNTLMLGYFRHGMTNKLSDAIKEEMLSKIPAGRLGSAYDLWKVIECLIQCGYINGANIDVNGGLNGI